MKKALLLIGILSVAALAACATSTDSTSQVMGLVDSNDDVITLSTLATSSLLPTLSDQTLSFGQETVLLSDNALLETTEDDPVVDNIEPYIELVEQLLGSSDGINVTSGASDVEGYTDMMTFSTSGLGGATQTHVIHYNMTLEEEEDDESEFILEGILIMGGAQYTLLGEREVEDGEEEVEFTAKLDDANYVISEYKVEEDKVELEVTIVADAVVVSQTQVEIKEEEDETKVELEFLDGENSGQYEFKFETEDGIQVLKIEYDTTIDGLTESGEITVSVTVDPVTGDTSYALLVDPDDDDAYEKEVDRDIDDDDDDEEDEEDEEDDDDDEEDDEDVNGEEPLE
jgi:hypothetical protein